MMMEKNRNKPNPNPRAKAFAMLARRALTRHELKDRLRKKKFSHQEVETVVADIAAEGYIDEKGIVEDYIRLGKEFRLVGRFFLLQQLKHRGIEEIVIQDLLDEHYPKEDENPIALEFATKKLQTLGGVEKIKKIRRLGGALSQRGFSSGIIHQVLGQLDLDDED